MKRLFILLLSAMSLTAFAQNDVKRVAILETVDKMGTVPYLKQLMFRSNLTTAITNTTGYEGYDRADLKEILGEQNFQRTGLVSDNDIKKIGEFTGAQYVLIAEATIDGDDMFITAKIIDVETARVIRNSNQLMGISASEMQEGSQKVAADLLGLSEQTPQKNDVSVTPQNQERKSRTSESEKDTSAKSASKKAGAKNNEPIEIHWNIDSNPQGAEVEWRFGTPIWNVMKFTYMGTTPFEWMQQVNLSTLGITYATSSWVFVEIKISKAGYKSQTRKFNLQSLIDDYNVNYIFELEPKK